MFRALYDFNRSWQRNYQEKTQFTTFFYLKEIKMQLGGDLTSRNSSRIITFSAKRGRFRRFNVLFMLHTHTLEVNSDNNVTGTLSENAHMSCTRRECRFRQHVSKAPSSLSHLHGQKHTKLCQNNHFWRVNVFKLKSLN